VLPDYYGSAQDSNNIESIAAGTSEPEDTWDLWMDSPPHKTHLTGSDEFFAAQYEFGIGHHYDPDSPYGHYWVVITALPGD
jgi:uncharacterized protein YkwD